MFEGSKNVPPMGNLTYIQRVGGNNNAGTSFDSTVYYNNLPSQYLDMGLWIEADRLRSLEITADNFENQRNAVKEEKAMRMDNVPYAAAIQNWLSAAWAGSGYDHPPIGSLEDLNSVGVDYVQQFFNQYYSPDNVVMVFVGDVEFAELKTKVEASFGDIPKGPARPPTRAVNIDVNKPLKTVVKDPLAQQALLLYGWHTVGDKHPDRPALDLLGNILLVGDSARIPKILNDEKKLVAFSGGTHFALQDAGFVFMQALPLPSTKRDALEAVISEEVAKIQKKGISKKELQKAINRQLMNTVATLATNQGRATAIAAGALYHDDPKHVLTELERYSAVTTKDIKRVAKQYLNDNLLSLEIQPGGGGMPMP
jgi:zinc protease